MWTSSGRNWGWCIIGFTTLFYFQAGENSQGLSFWQIQALIGLFFAIHLATYFFLVTWGTWIVLDQTSGKGPEIQVLCGCLVLFIHCWVEYACSTHPCSGSNCLTGSPSLIIKVCTTAPHKGPVPNQTYGGLNPMVIPINSYSHRKLIGHRNFAINFGRFFPVPQWFFQLPSGHRSFQTPGVPIASVLSTNLGWGFVLCYVLSYMLVSMGPSVFSEEFRAAGSWWDWDGLGIEKWDFNGISMGFQWDFIWGISPVCIPKLPSYSKETSGKSEESPHDDHSGWWIRLFFSRRLILWSKWFGWSPWIFRCRRFFVFEIGGCMGYVRNCWPNWMCRPMASFVLNSVICLYLVMEYG